MLKDATGTGYVENLSALELYMISQCDKNKDKLLF